MKKLYILSVLISTLSFAQIPANYYDSANGLSGYALKSQLKTITTNGHQSRTYDQLYDGDGISGSNGYIDTHSDIAVASGNNYENDGTILDMYSENPSGSDPYNFTHGNNQCGNQSSEGDCYNREHLVPQSSFNSAFPMQSDIHTVIPSDGRVNNFRGSLVFGTVNSPNWTSLNGSKRGTSAMSGYSGTVFEPIDEFKGDIARALLYFAVRYEDTVNEYTSFAMFDGTNDAVFFPWAIEVLLDWHNNIDPVDQRERDRNNAAYNFQNNANPFVDHPEYASMIWNPITDTEAPTAATNLIASNPTVNSINLSWTAGTDNTAVTSYDVYVDGINTVSTSNTSITVTGLAANTEFCFTVFARDAALNTAPSSNESCETTDQGTSTPNELFISEYVEGSSNNKAIEIVNFTGNSVNLSAYTIARDVNSNGAYGVALQLTGSISDGNVHVISRGNASAEILAVADQISSADAMSFNGDDPVGLFKNGTLIDIFGNFGGTNNFENATYRRKSTVINPTTAFDLVGEWDAYPQDDTDDLGNHQGPLNVNTIYKNRVSFFPNPVKSNQIFFNSLPSLKVEIYTLKGELIIEMLLKDSTKSIDISALNSGLYIVKMTTNFGVKVKKLIRQ